MRRYKADPSVPPSADWRTDTLGMTIPCIVIPSPFVRQMAECKRLSFRAHSTSLRANCVEESAEIKKTGHGGRLLR